MPTGKYTHKKGYTRPTFTKKWTNNLSKAFKGKKHPIECNHCKVMSQITSGERCSANRNWRGDFAKYGAIHNWLRVNFGMPKYCEFCRGKSKTSKTYDWALIDGLEYKRSRTHFIRLCRSCHWKYDNTTTTMGQRVK